MTKLADQMKKELCDRSLFDKVEAYGMDYIEQSFDRNVFPEDEDVAAMEIFDEDMPDDIGNAEGIIDVLHAVGAPATVSQIGGRYFGFVNGSVVPAGLLAKKLASFWDQNSGMQVISPIASKLESVVQNWLIDLMDLPKETIAGFVSGTSMASFCGLAAARYRILKNQAWDLTEQGMLGAPPIRIVAGKHAHSTILKAVSLLGFGKANIEWVDVDDQGRIIPEAIPELDDKSILILQAGNVNSGSFDPFENICAKAKEEGAWIHVDGAFGLWAAATERLNHLTKDVNLADSWAVDAHKTLNTPYDCGIMLCKDEEALVSSLHMTGGYIIVGEGRDGMFYTPEMSRRARIIELWATLKYLGRHGIDEMVYGLHERAKQFAEEISEVKGFEVINDVVFNQVMVKCESDELTDKVIAKIQELRDCWVGGSVWFDERVIRISVCAWTTTSEIISQTVASFQKAYQLSINS